MYINPFTLARNHIPPFRGKLISTIGGSHVG